MKSLLVAVTFVFTFCAIAPVIGWAQTTTPDTAKILSITGGQGSFSAKEGVYKVSFPRTDVKVTVDGLPMDPFMGLTSWAAFESGMNGAMVMGDLVLFEDEVNPVMSTALENGLAVTALHNHFFYDEPRVFFMHIAGNGPADQLAAAVRKTQDMAKSIRAASPKPATAFGGSMTPAANSVDAAALDKIFGQAGTAHNGMYKATFGRTARMADGMTAGNAMGDNTWAGFAGSSDHAVVDGDFVVRESELQPVLKILRGGGINIVAIHQHMTGEEPRFIFLHYWGKGNAAGLAQTVKQALNSAK